MRVDIASSAERLVYRVAGLPVALWALWLSSGGSDVADNATMEAAFAARYWHPRGVDEWSELLTGLAAFPLALTVVPLWFTLRNGAAIRKRCGRGLAAQWLDQLRLYVRAGILSPWYYIFSLYDDAAENRARTYLQRFETKPFLFRALKKSKGSPLNDKKAFADRCADHGVRAVETLMALEGKAPDATLPDRDIFVKPTRGRGGRGAQRWDCVAPSIFVNPEGERLAADALLARLVRQSKQAALIVQPRVRAHPALSQLTAGALPTIRVVTCLDEAGCPEVIGAVFRMSIGTNTIVDNLHAGGIAAAVDLLTGKLSRATNLGSDARLGWLTAHPDTGALIEGTALPRWDEVKALAIAAHRAFDDRVVVGWDIAVLDDGPILIEGNGNPDMDIIQRFMATGLRQHRFGELLQFHLRQRLVRPTARLPAEAIAS